MNCSKFYIKKIILLTLSFLVFCSMQAQNTLVMGKIKNAKLLRTIDLIANVRYLNNSIETYSSNIIEDNSFAFAVQITEPQFVSLEYARNEGVLFLEPNDTLYIEVDANNFQYSFEFSGKGAHNNKCLAQYLKTNPRETNIFEFTQYKQKNYNYLNGPRMDKLMMRMDESSFKNKMLTQATQANSIIDKYDKDHPRGLSETFKEFVKADITYFRAYHMLMYGHVFKNKYGITSEYFEFLTEIPFQSNAVGNEWYREFLVAYFDYMSLKAGVEKTEYVFEYDTAKKYLSGKALAFYQSEIIARAFRKKDQDMVLDRYWEFVGQNEYGQFDEKVLVTYAKAMKFAGGTLAPDFVMNDIDNNVVTLNSFLGKPVYLNFWASWCRPCMKKMTNMKTVQAELEEKGIVFLNVSLDRKEETWKETIEKNNYKGIHVLASGELNSEIAKAYEVKVLPQYFIINKQGKFVQNPKLISVLDVKKILIETAQK